MPYEVHLEVFDGPFDLLLQLITAQEVDLYEVRLADVVDGFLKELQRLEDVDLDVATEFLLIAATLVELKCRRLLPGQGEVDPDEELALFEARDYLLARLVECKTFSNAAEALSALEMATARSLARRVGPDERFFGLEPDLLAGVTPELLAQAAAKGLRARPVPEVQTTHLHADEASVIETLEELVITLPGLGRTSFRDLCLRRTRPQAVACFLALLELYKRNLVELTQTESFGDLLVIWTGVGELALDEVDTYGAVEVSR